MDPLTAKFKADFMRRVRFCPFLFTATAEYRSWSPSMKVDYQERLGMIDGDSPVTSGEAHVYAYHQVLNIDEP